MSLTAAQTESIAALAAANNLPSDILCALVEQESSGTFLWPVGATAMPAINIEPAYFYRILKKQDKALLAKAVAQGLARPTRGTVPSTFEARYAMLSRMAAISTEAAYRSISIGAGQVMGDNYAMLGYSSAKQMFDDAVTGADAQIRQMLTFIIKKPGMAAAIRKRDFKMIAYLYNGPSYRANHYDTDLADLTSKFGAPDNWTPRVLALGFTTVKAFQLEAGLTADGVIGPATKAAIVAEEQKRKKVQSAPAKNGAVVAGGGAVVVASGADVAVQSAQNSTSWLDTLRPLVHALDALGEYGPQIALIGVAAIVVGAVVYTVLHANGKTA